MYNLLVLFIITRFAVCQDIEKIGEGTKIALEFLGYFENIFLSCIQSSMPNRRFMSDDLHSYINEFSKTTVGYAPQFTSNRKFFANMISTPAFKEMMEKDINTLHNNMLDKIKFCDESVLNQDLLKQFYGREVDQTKL